MIVAEAAFPSYSLAVSLWVTLVLVATAIAMPLVIVLLGRGEPAKEGAIAVTIGWFIMVVLFTIAVILCHHAAWVDYKREHVEAVS